MDLSLLSSTITLLGNQLADWNSLVDLIIRFLSNSAVVAFIVYKFYFPRNRRRDYFFTYMLLSVSIFMLIYLMDGSKIQIGAALGLFAVFGIIRYRTESVPIREMTYLFFLVALSVVNAMTTSVSVVEFIVINLLFIGTAFVCEKYLPARSTACKIVKYDKIDLIRPDRMDELKADLQERLGVEITDIEIGSVNFLQDATYLKVYYIDRNGNNSVNNITKFPKE